MPLLNNIFDEDLIEINKVNKLYFKILIIIVLLVGSILIIKKDYYYKNNLLINDDNMVLVVDKNMINKVQDKKTILVNKIVMEYSIDKIIDQGNICYVSINSNIHIENISNAKYEILLGKEKFFEYIIRIIKKVS